MRLHCFVNVLLKSGWGLTTQILCFTVLKGYDSKTHSLKFYDAEIFPSSDSQQFFSVQREPEGNPLCFEGDELGGCLYFSIPSLSKEREVTSASGPAGSQGRVFSHVQSK